MMVHMVGAYQAGLEMFLTLCGVREALRRSSSFLATLALSESEDFESNSRLLRSALRARLVRACSRSASLADFFLPADFLASSASLADSLADSLDFLEDFLAERFLSEPLSESFSESLADFLAESLAALLVADSSLSSSLRARSLEPFFDTGFSGSFLI